MNRRLKSIFIAIFAAISMMVAVIAVAPAASAAGGDTSVPSVTVSQGSATTSSTVQAALAGRVTEVMFIMAKGLPKPSQTNCVTLKKAGVKYRVGNMTFRIGGKYWTDYYNSSHQQVWHQKVAQKGDKFCLVGKVVRNAECGNQARGTPLGPVVIKIVVVKRFSFSATATATTVSPVTATAYASCSINGNVATGSGFASAFASAKAIITIKGFDRSVVFATAKAQAEAVSIQSHIKVEGAIKLQVEATASASATATCNNAPPPPTPTPPTPTPGKDGTTQPPEGSAPGAPGGYAPPADDIHTKCWNQDTGNPVAPLPGGKCPPNSWGE